MSNDVERKAKGTLTQQKRPFRVLADSAPIAELPLGHRLPVSTSARRVRTLTSFCLLFIALFSLWLFLLWCGRRRVQTRRRTLGFLLVVRHRMFVFHYDFSSAFQWDTRVVPL